jgi:hypothetical protein
MWRGKEYEESDVVDVAGKRKKQKKRQKWWL